MSQGWDAGRPVVGGFQFLEYPAAEWYVVQVFGKCFKWWPSHGKFTLQDGKCVTESCRGAAQWECSHLQGAVDHHMQHLSDLSYLHLGVFFSLFWWHIFLMESTLARHESVCIMWVKSPRVWGRHTPEEDDLSAIPGGKSSFQECWSCCQGCPSITIWECFYCSVGVLPDLSSWPGKLCPLMNFCACRCPEKPDLVGCRYAPFEPQLWFSMEDGLCFASPSDSLGICPSVSCCSCRHLSPNTWSNDCIAKYLIPCRTKRPVRLFIIFPG